ncbi:MAG: hypothetical protein KDD63_26585, partial [Bacteroidetes bacterium]|nr:hypothetical protein [Bacteroidota bacterium]
MNRKILIPLGMRSHRDLMLVEMHGFPPLCQFLRRYDAKTDENLMGETHCYLHLTLNGVFLSRE